MSDGLTIIDSYAFQGCSTLNNLVVPNTVTTIGTGAFEASGLISITLSSKLNKIPMSCFADCSWLTTVNIPDGIEEISSYAFSSCSCLKKIIIPNLVKTLGNNIFYGCTQLTIYCRMSSKPSSWADDWNKTSFMYFDTYCSVVWGYKGS